MLEQGLPGFNIYGPEPSLEPAQIAGEAGRANHKVVRVVASAAALALAGMQFAGCTDNTPVDNAEAAATEDTTETTEPAAENTSTCPDTWEIEQIDHGNENRILARGMPAIGAADNRREARAALQDYFDVVKQDPEIFSGVASAILERDISPRSLVDQEGVCASPRAERVLGEIETEVFALGEVSPEDPSAFMTNTGTSNRGRFVAGTTPGITGSLDGITFTVEGRQYGVLERCGNLAMEGNPGIPEGPTDNPTPPPELPPPPPPTGVDDKHPVPITGGGPSAPIGPPTGPVIDNPNTYHPTTSIAPPRPTTPDQPVTTTTRPTTNPSTTTSSVPPTSQPPVPQG